MNAVKDLIREPRADRLWRHCLYRVATGKWGPGHRLPSVREAAERWGVDRRTVLQAYERLEDTGLVRRANRAGFFVADDSEHSRVSRHRHELERLHDEVAERVRRETGLSPLAAFRYLAQLAAIRATDQPECAFVECTAVQANAHAAELEAHLGVPCCGLTLAQLGGRAQRIPTHVRTLFVSAFHADELGGLTDQRELQSMIVPLKVSPTIADAVPAGVTKAVLLEADGGDAHDISADVNALLPDLDVSWQACDSLDDVEPKLSQLLAEPHADVIALLSPRVWGTVSEQWREHGLVRQVEFRVHESAWPTIADAIGLPLGTSG